MLAGALSQLDLIGRLGPVFAARHRLLALRAVPREPVYERIWCEAATAVGASVRTLGEGTLELRHGDQVTRVWQQNVPIDDPVATDRALDRGIVNGLLADAGVPLPEHVVYERRTQGRARAFLNGGDGPLVVKPASGTGAGHGVTCAVRSPADLVRATRVAARFASTFMAERQAAGAMYRLLLLDGELIGAVRRDPPCVEGNGRSTVAQLILAENRRRLAAEGEAGLQLIRPDLDFLLTLRAAGLSTRSVPAAGERVVVKTSTSENAPAENVTIHQQPSQALLSDAVAAVRSIGLRLAGVDVVTTDLDQDLRDTGGAIIEVNGTPGLHYHYLVSEPERAIPVAVPLLRTLLGLPDQ